MECKEDAGEKDQSAQPSTVMFALQVSNK